MKLLDTNIFLRGIAEQRTRQDQDMYRLSAALFDAVEAGAEEITTCEAVLDEIFNVLCSPRQYGMGHADAVELFRPVFDLEGFRLPRKRLYGVAIELFAADQRLDFADCLLTVFAAEDSHELLTYDERLAHTSGVEVYSG